MENSVRLLRTMTIGLLHGSICIYWSTWICNYERKFSEIMPILLEALPMLPGSRGTINEAGVFALRGRQEGNRRSRRTTTSTPRTTALAVAPTTVTSTSEDVAQPAALLAPDDQTWFVASTPTPENFPLSIGTSRLPPLEIVVKPADKVVLPCELGGNYSTLLPITRSYRARPAKWLHYEKPVDMITINTEKEISGTGHRYIGDSISASLHIDSAKLEDDGLWKCIIETDRGELLAGRLVKLVILEAPRGTYLLIDGRRLDPGNQFVPVKEGSDLTLECAAEGGNPPSILSWGMTLSQTTLDGPEQPPDNLTVVPSARGGHSGAHLKVLRGHHNATIICTARHVTLAMPLNASILLDVQYTPSFAITRLPGFGIPIVEGIPVSLKCEVDSNPSSLPVWQRDNGPPPVEQSDDGWLNFTKISRNDSGWYKCYTRHISGVFSSIGYFLHARLNPDSELEAAEALNGEATDSRKVEVQIGGAVTLECDGGCWGHGSSMDPVGGPGALVLGRVVYQDAGEYRCVAPDRKLQDTWRAQLPYHITVKGRPMVHPEFQTVTVAEGETLKLAVQFCVESSYTKLLWLSSESVYTPGGHIRNGVRVLEVEHGVSEASCFRTSLQIEAVQLSHAGEWLMIVRSPSGTADASISVNVTQASSFSNGHSHVHTSPIVLICLTLFLQLQPN
ncbi:hemicentin-2 isoform X2 [Diachasmimorpha longicaudata]|uniref:hemicentin-2 isoform X2 n=1 Tax=Diachasmimorpha longicaudata TaxID=58733 RepID=UPI0030B868F2